MYLSLYLYLYRLLYLQLCGRPDARIAHTHGQSEGSASHVPFWQLSILTKVFIHEHRTDSPAPAIGCSNMNMNERAHKQTILQFII